jgi:hypothetical protein
MLLISNNEIDAQRNPLENFLLLSIISIAIQQQCRGTGIHSMYIFLHNKHPIGHIYRSLASISLVLNYR